MEQSFSKRELILTTSLSGAVIGGVVGCIVLLLAQIDYHANANMLIVWLSSCILLFTIAGARTGYRINRNRLQMTAIAANNNNKPIGHFKA